MIDHTGINVSDLERSKKFYSAVLAALNCKVLTEYPEAVGFGSAIIRNVSKDPAGTFWVSVGKPQEPRIHIAFSANSRAEVDQFYEAAIKAGGTDNGPPGLRPRYHSAYYAAFILDPDGYNIEAVYHLPE